MNGGIGAGLLRVRGTGSGQRVTFMELFFDLVYVFAVTQLSHHLLHHPTITGALQTALLLAMVWLVWAYTAWVTNWLDPERMPVRLMLIALVLVALVMWATISPSGARRSSSSRWASRSWSSAPACPARSGGAFPRRRPRRSWSRCSAASGCGGCTSTGARMRRPG